MLSAQKHKGSNSGMSLAAKDPLQNDETGTDAAGGKQRDMNDQAETHIARGNSCRTARAISLLPVAILMATNLWGQLKTTAYAQPPAVVIEPVIVKPSGVYPSKIIRPQGPFVLYIENRLPGHAAHFSLTLSPSSGQSSSQTNATEIVGLNTSSGQYSAARFLDLIPGTYQLLIQAQGVGNPTGWSVTIQITN
jgi:hypothetical protein